MKRMGIIFLAMAAVGLMAGNALAGGMMAGHGEKPYYVSGGISYNLENFEISGLDPDYDNTWGLALAAGMCVAPHLSVEFDFDWLDDFEADDLILVGDDLVRVRSDVGIATYLVTAKVSPMAEPGTFDFYGLAGMGWMDGDADFVVTGVRTLGLGDTGGDFAAKVGAGAEYWPGLPVGFGLELAYVFGFGDMDEIQYTQLTGKAIYRF